MPAPLVLHAVASPAVPLAVADLNPLTDVAMPADCFVSECDESLGASASTVFAERREQHMGRVAAESVLAAVVDRISGRDQSVGSDPREAMRVQRECCPVTVGGERPVMRVLVDRSDPRPALVVCTALHPFVESLLKRRRGSLEHRERDGLPLAHAANLLDPHT